MNWFSYRDGALHAEQVAMSRIAEEFGTPAYVYSRAGLEAGYKAYRKALHDVPHLIAYAVKANGNLAVLNLLASLGAGFDIVSVGELERVLAAGGDPGRVVFSGVGKQREEIQRALEVGVHCFNVESETELDRIQQIAESMNKQAAVSLRVNPDVDAQTHPYISTGLRDNKFGIDINRALAVYQRAAGMPNIEITGVDCHIGSQLTRGEPFIDALDRLLLLVDDLQAQGIELKHIDIGGGLGIAYNDETPPTPSDYLNTVKARLHGRNLKLVVEPGRSIAGQAGILLTRVELIKRTDHKNFAVVDAAMNDLLRPSIYSAWHGIEPVEPDDSKEALVCDIVGPICETGDFLGRDRALKIVEGDLLAVKSAGAYGFGMSSNYNSRNRCAEIMVDGDQAHRVRRRETIADQLAPESLLPE
ncbi:diaminopimelate decarboxylase [Endozoicomonas euniceicola]|uniref:Diaminopimelate decarboxylase n=1 Tax=Endozoicomonas euniceicola TaxID=1234143 RepID=A0ABY6H118_9GAMM|nr:diaminopimelate decarboxylase [Endozoicomonas euniceicola]UYM18760.1 diaminopimelate decarboxylase [Endozoicomonas euniceicola]